MAFSTWGIIAYAVIAIALVTSIHFKKKITSIVLFFLLFASIIFIILSQVHENDTKSDRKSNKESLARDLNVSHINDITLTVQCFTYENNDSVIVEFPKVDLDDGTSDYIYLDAESGKWSRANLNDLKSFEIFQSYINCSYNPK